MVWAASGRNSSFMMTIPTGSSPSGSCCSSSNAVLAHATKSTLRADDASWLNRGRAALLRAGTMVSRMISGAPMTHVP